MLDRIEFLLSEAFVSLGRNKWMTFAAVTTCAMALLLLGGLGFAYMKIDQFAQSLPSKFEISVFFRDKVPADDAKRVVAETLKMQGVDSVRFLPKDVQWEVLKKEQPELTQGIPNPLPDSMRIRLKDLAAAPNVAKELAKKPEIGGENVKYLAKEQERLTTALGAVRLLGLALGGLMLITSGVLIYNAIRLTVVARRREHRIMHLVGANQATIALPLLLEGFVQGLLGGLIAFFAFWGSFAVVRALMISTLQVGGTEVFPITSSLFGFVAAGGVYGLICSLLAVRGKTLKGAIG